MTRPEDELCDGCEEPICNGKLHGAGHCFGGPAGLPLDPAAAYAMGKRRGEAAVGCALAFERVTVMELRQESTRRLMRLLDVLDRVRAVLSEHGCDCECKHHYEEHEDKCERCLACRTEAALDGARSGVI